MRSLVAAIALVASMSAARAEVIALVPMVPPKDRPRAEAISDEDVAFVRQALTLFYGVEVRLLPSVTLPAAAWYPPRRRWRAEKLLDALAAARPADARFVLGLTAADISTTKGTIVDWGVMGLGSIDGTAGVISSFRSRKGARDARHARERLGKVAVHELGHVLGLEHCPTRGCLMEDAEGKVATTDREHDLCPRCRALLRARGRPLPDVTPPW